MRTLYRKVDPSSKGPVQYVGVYVLKWAECQGKIIPVLPEVAFVEEDPDKEVEELIHVSVALGRALEGSDWRNATMLNDGLFRRLRAVHNRMGVA